MSRRRDLSTDISVDKKLKRVSDFAALLYTWMIPHADDFCRLVAKDAEEINLLVVPNRRKTDEQVSEALDELFSAELIGQDESGHYFLPSSSFYKYQTKIPVEKRVVTPKPGRPQLMLPLPSVGKNTDERRLSAISPEKGVLPSSSLSLTPSPSIGSASAAPLRARAELVIDNDLGLGEKHPAVLCGWGLWNSLEQFWKVRQKRLTIFQVEMINKFLSDAQQKGHDPTKIVEKSLRNGWMDLYEPDKEPTAATPVMNREEIKQRAIENGKRARAQS